MSDGFSSAGGLLKLSVEPIQADRLRIGDALQRTTPEALPQGATASVGTLRWAVGSSKAASLYYLPGGARKFDTQEFTAQHNLDRVLQSRTILTDADRALAKAALERLGSRKDEDMESWADRLSADLSAFNG